jgi:hypothetical protein
MPSYESAIGELRRRVTAMGSSEYDVFKLVLAMKIAAAEKALGEAQQADTGSTGHWGVSSEDRIAELLANIQSGRSAGPGPLVQQAAKRLQDLRLARDYAESFRAEHEESEPATEPSPSATSPTSPVSPPSPARTSGSRSTGAGSTPAVVRGAGGPVSGSGARFEGLVSPGFQGPGLVGPSGNLGLDSVSHEVSSSSAVEGQDPSRPEAEPMPTERRAAFAKHLRRIQEMREAPSAKLDWLCSAPEDDPLAKDDAGGGPVPEMDAAFRRIELDREQTRLLPLTQAGLANAEVLDRLTRLADAYRRLADRVPVDSQLVTRQELMEKVGLTLSMAARTAELLAEDARALDLHQQTIDTYQSIGAVNEVDKARERFDHVRRKMDDDPEQEIMCLRERLLQLPNPGSDPVERADILIDLGFALLAVDSPFEARGHLHEAEALLARVGEPAPEQLAEDLMATMRILQGGGDVTEGTPLQDSLGRRGLWKQLYMGLAAAYKDTDPAREKDYNAKAQQMDSRSASDSFGKTAQALLDGRYKDVLK